jgi:ABC-type nitrate/sulfonate/bicarbonate transport system substrate-binding protein
MRCMRMTSPLDQPLGRTPIGGSRARFAAAALAMLLTLSACGGAAAPASAQAAPSSAAAKAAASVSAKPSQPAGAAASGQMRKVKLAWATQTTVFLPPHAGLQAGIFQKHGIDLSLVYTGSGPTNIAAIVSGDVQFAEQADPSITNSALEGSGVEWIAVSVPKPNLALFVQPNINSVQDLKGKKVGVTTLGSLTALFANLVLQQNGLDPKKDVQVLAVGGGLEAQSAMLNNQVDAIVTAPATPLPGKKILVDLRTGFDFPQGGLAATKSFVQKEPPLVQDMVTAFVESIRRFKTDRALAEEIDTRELKRSDPAAVKAEVDEAIEVLTDNVTPTPKQLKTVLDMLAPDNPKAASAKPEDFFDERFGKAAAQQAAK